MNFCFLCKFFLYFHLSVELVSSLSPLELLNYGTKSLFDIPILNGTQKLFSFLSQDSAKTQDETNLQTSKEEGNTLYGVPIADSSSVIESLFEINAREFLNDTEFEQVVTPIKREEENSENSLNSLLNDFHFLPLKENKENSLSIISPDDKELHDHLDSIRKDAWSHFKSIILGYVNILDPPNQNTNKTKDSLPVKMLLQFLNIGDNLNILHLLGKKVDPGVHNHFFGKMKYYFKDLVGEKIMNNSDMSNLMPSMNSMVNQFAWISLRYMIDDLLKKVFQFYTKAELDKYIEDLETRNSFAAKGIRFVLNLPDEIPQHNQSVDGRAYRRTRLPYSPSRDRLIDSRDYIYADDGYNNRDDHYGHGHKEVHYETHSGGGYGHSPSYKQGVYLDPYLILAGIGTAALLAFLAFRILTTAAAVNNNVRLRPQRSVDMDSDSVDFIHSIFASIERSKQKYELPVEEKLDRIVADINELWKDHKTSPKHTLNQIFQRRIKNKEHCTLLLLSVFSHLIGIEGGSRMLDRIEENEGDTGTPSMDSK